MKTVPVFALRRGAPAGFPNLQSADPAGAEACPTQKMPSRFASSEPFCDQSFV
jgi:hypothetical protein